MNIGDRIKQIRKENKKSQDAFGEIIRIGKSAVSKLENGENSPSDQTVTLICNEFNINEEWLRYGTGEMEKTRDDRLAEYIGSIAKGDDEFILDLIEVYMELDQSSKDALKMIAKKMAEKQNKRGQN